VTGDYSNQTLDFSATNLDGIESISGGAGNDTVIGSDGDDVILASDGYDDLHGGAGDDTFLYSEGDGADDFHGGEGNDTVKATGDDTNITIDSNFDAENSIETISSDGHSGVTVTGDYSNQTLDFSATNLDGIESISGGAGNDTIRGASSDDNLDGGTGTDTLRLTGDRIDYIVSENEDGSYTIQDLIEGRDGTDTVSNFEYFQFADETFDTNTVLNDPTRLTSDVSDQATAEDAAFSLDISSHFADGDEDDTLTYSATLENGDPLPSWLSIDPSTGTLSGTPENGDVGSISVTVTATDAAGTSASDTFGITVENTNDGPVATAIADQTTDEDAAFSLDVSSSFSDEDASDTLTYSATLENGDPLPSWLSIDPNTGALSGTPANGDVGAISVTVTATDTAGASASETFGITIENTNDGPVATAIADQNLDRGDTFDLDVSENFSDVDVGDTLTYTATLANGDPLPSWLSFDSNTGQFSGTPVQSDSGLISVKVVASDGTATAEDTFTIDVNATVERNGDSGSNVLNGDQYNDSISGAEGDDTLTGNGGDDTIDGEAGTDTAIYSGNREDYTVVENEDGSYQIQDNVADRDGTDTVSNVESFTFADGTFTASEVLINPYNIDSPSNGETYTVAGSQGTDQLNLSDYALSSATFGDGTITIDLGGGQSFTVEYSGLEQIQFSDTMAYIADGDRSESSQTGNTTIISGPRVFSITLDGDGSYDYSYDATNGTIDLTSVEGTTNLSTLTVTQISGPELTVSSINVDADLGTFSSDYNIGTIDIASDVNIETLTVTDAGGTVSTLNYEGSTDSNITVNADLTTLSSSSLWGGNLTVNGDLGTFNAAHTTGSITVTGNATSIRANGNVDYSGEIWGDVTIGGDLGTIHAADDIEGALNVTGNATTISADDDLHGPISVGGHVTTISAAEDIEALIDVTGNVGTLSAANNIRYQDITIGGNLDSASAGISIGSNITVGGDLGTIHAGDDIDGALDITGNASTISADDDLHGPITVGGHVTTISAAEDVEALINVTGNVGTLSAVANIRTQNVSVGGNLDTVTAGSNIESNITAGGNLGTITVANTLLGDLTAGGSLNTLTAARIEGDVSTGGDVSTIQTIGGTGADIVGDVTIGGHITTLDAADDIEGNITIAGNAGTISAGDDIKIGTVNVTGDIDAVTVGDMLSGSLSTSGDLRVLTVGTDLSGSVVVTGRLSEHTVTGTVSGTLEADIFGYAPTTAISDQNTEEDAAFSLDVSGNFADGDNLTYSATLQNGDPLPDWLSVNASTGEISGTPLNQHVGSISILVTATGGDGYIATDEFGIAVTNTNDGPVATAIADQTTDEDAAFSLNASSSFSDVDAGDTLTYSATLENGDPLPSWLSIDANTGVLTGTPENGDVGAISVTVTATDTAGATASDTFGIAVHNTNDGPVATPIADQSGNANYAFSLDASSNFSDVDAGDTLTYSATLDNGDPLPDWLSIDLHTGELSGTPGTAHIGSINVKVTASDGHATAEDTFAITIDAEPGPVGQWKLDESSGTTATDSVGTNDGTYNSGVTVGSNRVNREGTAAEFDGVDDHVLISPSSDFQLSEGSFAVSFNAEQISGKQTLFSRDSRDYDGGGHLDAYVDSDGSLVVRIQSDSQTYFVSSASSAVNAGQNHSMAVTFGSEGVQLFLDGTLVDSNAYTGGITGNNEPITLGAGQQISGDGVADTLQNYFQGRIDNFEVYDFQINSGHAATLHAAVATEDETFTGDNATQSFTADSGNDSYDGGSGNDAITFSGVRNEYTVVDNLDGTYTITDRVENRDGVDTFENIESLIFTDVTHTASEAATYDQDTIYTGDHRNETILTGSGDDTISTGSGDDYVSSGAGDDTVTIGELGSLDELHFGEGEDALILDNSGQNLDFTLIDNLHVSGLERIDIDGSGANSLKLTAEDVLDMTDGENRLFVDGNSDDTVEIDSSYTNQGTETIEGSSYSHYYDAGTDTHLYINTDITDTHTF
ncbi:putative Ig domain-containing protein, partial [Pelagicoccus sp. SDUM812005]|uniref:putative Ig domain-containing protein n=1 Tax=Pelagicoccus sp. SDUM812005 TaxID=3041257 RepID=UPI00280DC701